MAVGPGTAGTPMTAEELAAFNEFNGTNLGGKDYYAVNPVTGEEGAWYWLGTMGWINAAPSLKSLSGGTEIDRHGTDDFWWKDPDVSWSLAGQYGTNPNNAVNPDANFANPDWEGAQNGAPVGGIGATSGMGQMVYWSKPETWQATEQGQLIETPAGNYKAYYNTSLGQWVLHAEEGALNGGISPWMYNHASGGQHIGINPFTGEIWYQSALRSPNAGWAGVEENYDPVAEYQAGMFGDAAVSTGSNTGTGASGGNVTTQPPADTTTMLSQVNNPNAIGSSWLDVLNRQGRDLESWDGFLGTFTGLPENPDWLSMDSNQVQQNLNNIWDQGLFSGLSQNQVYADLLKRLGFA